MLKLVLICLAFLGTVALVSEVTARHKTATGKWPSRDAILGFWIIGAVVCGAVALIAYHYVVKFNIW